MKEGAFLRGIFLTVVLCALALAFTTCGGRKSAVNPPSIGSGGLQAADSLDDALAELDALPTPDGVDPALFEELKDALAEALNDSCRAGIYPRRSTSGMDGGGHKWPPYSEDIKLASSPSTGNTNRIDDLACSLSDEGEYVLSWLYRNCGDYDQNGAVGIEDITPMAMHFGEDAAPENEWIDGDSDGRVHISDITPIAMYFGVNVHHYSVQGSHFFSSQFTETAQLEFPESAPNDTRFELEHSLGEEPEYLYWRIVPVDDEGNPGDTSNTAQVSAAPPPAVRILSVNPLGGVTGTEVSFSAVVTGEAPFDYEWNFGGGAEPNQPSGISDQVSAQVTLGAVDTYDAQLAVENAEGSALKHFTLTVTAEPGEPPEIVSVSPTEGDSGTEATFTAEVTGDETFTYYWDFGGGASPNQSSGVSGQPSATVTLSRGGTLPEPVVTYPARLTVTNPFGMTTHDFDLNVSAWWHVEEIPPLPDKDNWYWGSPVFGQDGYLYGLYYYDSTPGEAGGDESRLAKLVDGEWLIEKIMDGGAQSWSLALDSQDNPAISYGLRTGEWSLTSQLHFIRKEAEVWIDQFIDPGGISLSSQLFFDSPGKAIIQYSYHGGGNIAREAPGGWEFLDQPGGQMAIDEENHVFIAYSYADMSELRINRETDEGWENELLAEVQGDGNIVPYGIALDSMGLARILHWGGSSVGLRMARELPGGSFELGPVESHPDWVSMVTFLALLWDDTEVLFFTHRYGEEQPVVGWRTDDVWCYQDAPITGWTESLSLLIHSAGYPVLVSKIQMAAYW